MLTVFQYVQIVITGNFQSIEVNPATNEPKADDWEACCKMLFKQQPCYFLKVCL